jgi:hypothetical protein
MLGPTITTAPASPASAPAHCEHEEHAMQCEALIDPLVSRDAVCPCKDVPVPGVISELNSEEPVMATKKFTAPAPPFVAARHAAAVRRPG